MDDGQSPAGDSGYSSGEPLRTHPDKFDYEHVETLREFANDLNQALQGSFPRSAHPYTAVHVLLLRWADDDLQVQSEIERLRRVFDRQFHFDIEEWQIPSSNPTRALQYKLFELQHAHQSESELLIVYYGGHGVADRRGRSIWRANQRLDSPTLTWSSLQHLLENALPHVLIILDCCFAANAARDTTDGTAKEILAACGRENPTLGVGIRSFTSALIEELQAFGNKPFSVVMLHARLVTLRWRLAFTPIHTLLSEHGGTSIQLAPLPIVDVSMKPISDQSLEGSERNPAQNISVNTANTPSSPFPPPPPTPETRVLLSVSVARGSYYDLGQWATWLTSQTPLGVTNVDVRLESVFDSHSTLFVVSLPTYAWVRLPEKAAYQFVGFIRSGNLLSNNQASADSTTHLLRKRKSTVLEQADIHDVEKVKVICLSDFPDEQLDTRVPSYDDSGYFSPKRVEKYLRAERLHETEWMECTSGQM